MIQVAPGTKVGEVLRPLRMRYGFDGLSAKVVEVLRGDPFSGGSAHDGQHFPDPSASTGASSSPE